MGDWNQSAAVLKTNRTLRCISLTSLPATSTWLWLAACKFLEGRTRAGQFLSALISFYITTPLILLIRNAYIYITQRLRYNPMASIYEFSTVSIYFGVLSEQPDYSVSPDTLSLCRSSETRIRYNRINTWSQFSPLHHQCIIMCSTSLPPITCPVSHLRSKGYAARINTSRCSFSSLIHMQLCAACHCHRLAATFHLSPYLPQSSGMQIGSDRAIVNSIREKEKVKRLGQDQWVSGLSVSFQNCFWHVLLSAILWVTCQNMCLL